MSDTTKDKYDMKTAAKDLVNRISWADSEKEADEAALQALREAAAEAFEEAADRLNNSRGEHPGKVVAEFLARAAALRGKEPCCEIDASRWPYGHSCPPAAPKPKGEDS